jgi:integrase
MPQITASRAPRTPKYCRHRASGQAVVRLGGRDVYLGPYRSRGSREAYDRAVAEWLAGGRTAKPVEGQAAGLSVAEVALGYLGWAEAYYRGKDGQPSKEFDHIKRTIRPLRELFGRTPAADFGPLRLKALRERFIAAGQARAHINTNVQRVKRVFAWAVENELVPASSSHALAAVAGLKRGRSEAREGRSVKPVPDAYVDAILATDAAGEPLYVTREVAALVELLRLTGARTGELLIARTCDIDTSGPTWTYTPRRHKTEHHGAARVIYFGPLAQAILRPWMRTNLTEPIFSPARAMARQRERRAAARRTPLSCGNKPGSNRVHKPMKSAGEIYTANSFRRAIEVATTAADRAARAKAGQPKCSACAGRGRLDRKRCGPCGGAGYIGDALIPHWHPHQLRHNYATAIRRQFGLDAAKALLGHRDVRATAIYAELDSARATEIASKIG